MSANSIDLGRTFLEVRDLPEGTDPEDLAQVALAVGGAKTWPKVLENRYLVVLGEAGTGKSTEFQRQAVALAESGRYAFFVEIVSVARDGLRLSLKVAEEPLLDAWLASGAEATFFLDSLDEAKLQQRSLKEALGKLQRELRGQWARVRLVISCRVSDWRDSDRAVVEDVVPPESRKELQVVSIAPLEGQSLALMAAHVGVRDVNRFIDAVTDGYAQAFVQRPLDVEWLGAYWTKHRRIGSLRELIAENVTEKLIERAPQRQSTLPLEKARQGARALAGIATLTRRLSVALPGDPVDVQRAQTSIDTNEVFADWTRPEIEELLRTGLFDESTYGRVRFHHRTVQDYLAASWLHELRTAGLPLQKVRELFVREEAGKRAVPQHLGPVLAWLCLWDAALRAEMIQEAPALLIAHGDPSGFSEKDRSQILHAYAGCYKGRSRLFTDFEDASLERFSTPALAGPVAVLLAQQDLSEELTSFLLELVELGNIRACLPDAVRVALDVGRGRARVAAMRAVAAIGDIEHRRQLLTLLDTTETWQQDVAGAFVRALYPEVLDVAGLMRVLERSEGKRKNFTTLLQGALEFDVPKRGDLDLRLELLDRLLILVRVEDEEGKTSVAAGRDWMLRALAHVLGAVLDEMSKGAAQPPGVTRVLEFFRWCNEHNMRIWYGVDQVQEAVARHPEVRRVLFWQRVEEHRQKAGRVPRSRCELGYRHDLFELTSGDIPWLANDAKSRPDLRERLLAFDALAFMPRTQEANEQHLDMLRQVASTEPALKKRLARLMVRSPRRSPEEGKWARQERAWKIRGDRRQQENRASLEAVIDQVRDGSNLHALYFLLHKAQEEGLTNRWGVAATDGLRDAFGDEVAIAAEQGWRAFWRTYEPPLPHERERNSTPWEVIVGLVGLTMDFAKGLNLATLQGSLVVKASRYAANELNGFPDWFEPLVSAHGATVVDALKPTILADFNSAEDVHGVLAKLSYGGSSIKAAFAPAVLDLVTGGEPMSVKALKEAIGVCLSTEGLDLTRLDAIVGERCLAARGDRARFGVWWLTWAVRDGAAAIEFLERLTSDTPRDKAYAFVEEICHRIHDGIERAPIALRHDLDTLARLVPIVYDFIAIKDDVDHEDAFTPGRRDDAQEVRGLLVKWIADAPGPDAVAALQRVAQDPRIAPVREWILHQADARMVANAGSVSAAVEDELVNLYRAHGVRAAALMSQFKQVTKSVKIVFLAANPTSTKRLRLDDEARQIQQKLRASELRDSISLVPRLAVQPGDLQQLLLEEQPTIVHFSGHGDEAKGLVFHGETRGTVALVGGGPLRNLFRVLKDQVRVVVLNACYSADQAHAIAEEIDFVVGMSDSIGDEAAIKFAAAFYRGLAFGRSVQASFELGVSEMELAGHGYDAQVPVLMARRGADVATVLVAKRE
ncbi:MAG: CHAT domain-containing protein [Planctomycetes bacterium]|nr:CHAT domain-containing protein [Planctomycetota bacterium]